MNKNSFATILLAAGNSSRLGSPKQLIPFHGKSLLEKQIELALTYTDSVYIVLGAYKERLIVKADQYPVKIVHNTQWHLGMGSSIACGAKMLSDDINHVMLLTVDQWRLTHTDIENLRNCSNDNPASIIVSQWFEQNEVSQSGPPVIFPKAFFTKLIRLSGAQGAKTIVAENKTAVRRVKIANASYDIDTLEDLHQMNKLLEN